MVARGRKKFFDNYHICVKKHRESVCRVCGADLVFVRVPVVAWVYKWVKKR